MTRVGMNLLWCVPGGVGGSEEYFVRQLVGLAACEHEFAVTPYVLPAFAAAHPDVAARFELVVAPVGGVSRARRIVAESTWLAGQQRRRGDQLAHHGGGTMPARGVRPAVLTIHDLQYLSYPQYFSAVKLRYLRARVPRSVRRAQVLTVPSAYVKATVAERFAVDQDRIVVVPNGLEPTVGLSPTPEGELRARFGLGHDTRVLVYTAATFPHKRHDLLVHLMQTVWTDPDLRLLMVGGEGLGERRLQERIAACDDPRIIRGPRVNPSDRDGLVQLAEAVVFPSEYEGFGAPLIEAMALGAPIIANGATAIPEVLGNAGIILGPDADEYAWGEALASVPSMRHALVSAGRVRAAHFTAESSAKALLTAYRSALA